LQKKQRHECNIQQRTWAWPYLFGVDFECGLPEADRSESHHRADQHDQQQAGGVLTARRQGSRGEGRGRDLEEQIELLDQKAKRHDGDRRAHPGKKRPLIRRVVAIPLDHRATRPKGAAVSVGPKSRANSATMAPNETVTVTLISLLMQRIYSQRTDGSRGNARVPKMPAKP
jgi:hypothetical protein